MNFFIMNHLNLILASDLLGAGVDQSLGGTYPILGVLSIAKDRVRPQVGRHFIIHLDDYSDA